MHEVHVPKSPQVTVVRASPADMPHIADLLELYIQDFSEFLPLQRGTDGRYGYPDLPLYWTDPSRHPFLIQVDSQPGGFALVKRGSERSGNDHAWDMVEFFVLQSQRHRGVGLAAAQQLFTLFPGPWEVRVLPANRAAIRFWDRVISDWSAGRVPTKTLAAGNRMLRLFSFASPAKSM